MKSQKPTFAVLLKHNLNLFLIRKAFQLQHRLEISIKLLSELYVLLEAYQERKRKVYSETDEKLRKNDWYWNNKTVPRRTYSPLG